MRGFANCWIVAMWVWLHYRTACPVGIRRSHPFWFVPHFIATMPGRWRRFFSVEFVPPRRKRWTRDDCVLLFRGRYLVVEYRVVGVHWFDTREELIAWHRGMVNGDRCSVG